MKKFLIFGWIIFTFIIFYYIRISCHNNRIYVLHFPTDTLRSIIFYIEPFKSNALNSRQTCAIESAARHHLHSKVKVFIVSSKPVYDTFSLNHSLSNINFIQTSYESIFKDTPLEQWYQTNVCKNKPCTSNYINNAVRFLLIWKIGGIYLDTDVIALRTMHFQDFVVIENDSSIITDMFGFHEKHPFSSLCLDYLKNNYNLANKNDDIGNITMTRTLINFCKLDSVQNTKKKYCKIHTISSSLLFPVPSKKWSDYFSSSKSSPILQQMKDSHAIHIYNNLSNEVKVPLGSGTALEEVMRSNCPLVYHHIARTSGHI